MTRTFNIGDRVLFVGAGWDRHIAGKSGAVREVFGAFVRVALEDDEPHRVVVHQSNFDELLKLPGVNVVTEWIQMTSLDEARAAKRRAMERLPAIECRGGGGQGLGMQMAAVGSGGAFYGYQSPPPVTVSIGTTSDPPPAVYEECRVVQAFDLQWMRGDGRWMFRGGPDRLWIFCREGDVPQAVKDALAIKPALTVETTAERPLWTTAEVERAKDYGSERYAEQALLCDAAQEASEREWKEYWGPISDWHTNSDDHGEVSECTRRDSEETAAARMEMRRNFKRPLPGETPGDWARRNGVLAPWADRFTWEAHVRAEMDAVARGEPVT